jgi:hypothetical protein
LETADASLAARRDERRFGIAIAAMMPMMITTTKSSMSEKPFDFSLFFNSPDILRLCLCS